MKDIIGAMAKANEYLEYRKKGEEPFHLVDAVREFGFESLKEYFAAKRDYEFSLMEFEVVETVPERYIEDLFANISDKNNALLLCDTNETVIAHGDGCVFNESYCNECGYKMFPLYSGGGAIVFNEGDIAVGLMINKEAGFDKDYLIKNIVEIISRHTDKAVAFSGNDILVGDEKVSGSTTYDKNDMFAIIFNLSFSDKTELISKICTKHSAKQPGYIDFMTREDFKREVLEWLTVR